ncbi:glycosyltransferase family 2 protein [Streptacidiphilus sp. P02-A3a]|uniref:glycosyltransferase n=1 Tax=Streptacidiphilus sp. P02-A3a TaxID=2704468 RepID=UPI0015FA133F|nr:glycosyltransferase [Streptacidiphilus sp. P02-A3a]QMU69782.1 glycosyltransferase [Streptacidiphilus sp. P02-A3a]
MTATARHPGLSVVLTSRDDPWLFRALRAVQQTRPGGEPLETVVVLHRSRPDYTRRVLAAADAFGRPITVCALDDDPTISGARNCGAGQAAHRTLLFLDSDCELAPDALRGLARWSGAVANGRVVFRPGGSAFSRNNCLLREIGYQGLRGRMPYMPNLLIDRDVFDRVGGFRPDLSCGEDFELGDRLVRAGAAPEYLPGLTVTHLDDQHWTKTLRNWFRNGRGGGTRRLLAPPAERRSRRPLFLVVPQEWSRHGPQYAAVSLLGSLVLALGYLAGRARPALRPVPPLAAYPPAPAWVRRLSREGTQ